MTTAHLVPPSVDRPAEPGKTFCEFFAGIGLVRAGLEPSGWECLYANDNDPNKRAMYEARFGSAGHFHFGDVTRTDEVLARLGGRPFLATASFPCVDLSLAGHYKGFSGASSSTFFAFAELLRRLGDRRPEVVLLENVTGFLTSRRGEDFGRACSTLAGLGYWLDAFVLDASHFTPQSRPRVFVVGVAAELRPDPKYRGTTAGRLFPLPSAILRPAAVEKATRATVLETGWVQFALPEPPARVLDLADVVDADDGQEWWGPEEVEKHYRMMHDRHRHRVDQLLATGRFWVGTIFRRIRDGAMRAEVRFDGLAGCLRTPRGGSAKQIVVVTQGGRLKMRWMSPAEYARLQGAADFPLTRRRLDLLWGFADAVCVPAISWIDRHLLSPLYTAASLTGSPTATRFSA